MVVVLLAGLTALPRQPAWNDAMLSPPLEALAGALQAVAAADFVASNHLLRLKAEAMCGILGVVADNPVNQLLYDGLLVLQHRGQDAAGIVTADGANVPHAQGRAAWCATCSARATCAR